MSRRCWLRRSSSPLSRSIYGEESVKRGHDPEIQTRIAKEQRTIADEQSSLVERERIHAIAEARIYQSIVLASRAASMLDEDPDLSLALALGAIERAKTTSADSVLRRSLAHVRVRAMIGTPGGSKIVSVAYDRDGARIALARVNGTAQIWDTVAARLVREFDNKPVGGRSLKAAEFSDEGRYLTTLDDGGALAVYDLRGSTSRPYQKGGPPKNIALTAWSFNGDRSRVAVATFDGAIRVWALPSAQLVLQKTIPNATVQCLAFSSDGASIAVGLRRVPAQQEVHAPPDLSGPTANDRRTVFLFDVLNEAP